MSLSPGLKILALVICLNVLAHGCGQTSSSHLEVSDDGVLAAFTYARMWVLPVPPEIPVIRTRVFLAWCNLAHPEDRHQIKIFSRFGGNLNPWAHEDVHPVFAPDGRHLAAAGPQGLWVVNMETGNWEVLAGEDESIWSLGWISHREIGFVALTGNRRSFWCQPIDPLGPRRLLFSETVEGGYSWPSALSWLNWPRESWSPDGKGVLFVRRTKNIERLTLLDTSSGRVKDIGRPVLLDPRASWAPDSSAFFFLSGTENSELVQALVFETSQGQSRDLAKEVWSAFGGETVYPEPLWTADGRFIILNSTQNGGCLIRPHPWKVIYAGKKIQKEVIDSPQGLAEGRTAPRSGGSPPWIFRQPVVGAVLCRVAWLTPTGKKLGDGTPVRTYHEDYWKYLYDTGRAASLGMDQEIGSTLQMTRNGHQLVILDGSTAGIRLHPVQDSGN